MKKQPISHHPGAPLSKDAECVGDGKGHFGRGRGEAGGRLLDPPGSASSPFSRASCEMRFSHGELAPD